MNEIQGRNVTSYEEISGEINEYLFRFTVRIHFNRIVCNLVKEGYNGSAIFHISPGLFEHSKRIQEFVRITPDDQVISCFRKALEEVFGLKYSKNIQIRITK